MTNFLKAYGKVDEGDQMRLDSCWKTRKRMVVIGISAVVLVLVVVSAVVGTSRSHNGGSHDHVGSSQSPSASASLKAVCDTTLYPNTCFGSLSPFVNSSGIQPDELLRLAVVVAIDELAKVSTVSELKNCSELLDLALDHLNDSLSAIDFNLKTIGLQFDDLLTWLSTAGTYQQTCVDSLDENALSFLQKSTELTSNSLAIVNAFSRIANANYKRRKLLSYEMPEWVSVKDRKLLQQTTIPAGIKPDVFVAQDGSGKYTKISDALNAVPDNSNKRFVIYVKKGTYFENVAVGKTKWNVVMIGDGMDSTIVSGSLNVVDGTPTFQSATFGRYI